MSFSVAIIGRPNVGKSSLFNRLTGKRHALVHDMPGVTRDRREAEGRIGSLRFRVIDTAGLEETGPDQLESRMMGQTSLAIDEADIVLMMVDGRAGVTPMDEKFARWVRKKGKPTILVVNKCEGSKADQGFHESLRLGFSPTLAISAEHNMGMADLYEAVAQYAPEIAEEEQLSLQQDINIEVRGDKDNNTQEQEDDADERQLQIAIVGRPNVGKSTLMNQLLGQDRVLTGPEAGITRDSIAINWEFDGRPIKLIDTAGVRRKANVTCSLEKMSLQDTFRAIQFAHVVILLIDAENPLEKQDLAIAGQVIKEGRGIVLAVNKWDKIKKKQQVKEEIEWQVEQHMPEIKGVPVILISALEGKNLDALIQAALDSYTVWKGYVPTAKLNEWLKDAESFHPPPLAGRTRIRLKYITQGKKRPPTFMIFCNRPDKLPKPYVRYLMNSLREVFDFPGIPLRILLRKADNPYSKKK